VSVPPLSADPYDYLVYACPRCGERAVSVHSSDPEVVLRCDRCEQRYYPSEEHEARVRRALRSGADPFRGAWEVWDNEERQGGPLRVDLDDALAASSLYPEEFSPGALRRRAFRENVVLLGCTGFTVLFLVLLFLSAYRCA
jgi:uncharacterized C2H2 Zn-finger protein